MDIQHQKTLRILQLSIICFLSLVFPSILFIFSGSFGLTDFGQLVSFLIMVLCNISALWVIPLSILAFRRMRDWEVSSCTLVPVVVFLLILNLYAIFAFLTALF